MQPISNWENIQATNGGSSLLPMGGYACKIVRVNDHTMDGKTPYLEVVFDPYIKDENRFVFADIANDPTCDWRHNFKFWVGSDYGQRLYKKLVECVEASNNGFVYQNVAGAEQSLVGKWVGFLVNHRIYINNKGNESTVLDLGGSYSVEEIQNGNFPEPKLRDDREKTGGNATASKPADLYDEDVPF